LIQIVNEIDGKSIVKGQDTIAIQTKAQTHQLLFEWNQTQADYPKDKCIHQLFEEQVERSPDAIAVVFEEQQLTYGELNAKANQLAHYLQTLGVGSEVLVGVCVDRSIEMIIGILGILKAGGAYVPLDPTYPPERLAFMLEDSAVSVLLTQSHLNEQLPTHLAQVVYLGKDWEDIAQQREDNPTLAVTANNLAYVIYTSGSTGQPKGVLIEHQGVVNLVSWHQCSFAISSTDRATQLASPAFDASVWEIWSCITAGASLYIVNEDIRVSPFQLRDWLVANAITISFLPTPLAESILSLDWSKDTALRVLLTGGDRLKCYPTDIIPFQVVNNYGPTEKTVVTASTVVSVLSQTEQINVAPAIGRPIANTQVYILDPHLQPVPIGVSGEIYIGGDGLARGYLNRPDLTTEKFIPNPFSDEPNSRLYKTGDLARYLPDGNIEFLGRIDHQVKIRGFRIELGEIEAMLRQHPAVVEAVVIAKQYPTVDRKYLAAFIIITAHSKAISRSDFRSFLKEKLPDYMIPGVFITLDSLPLTLNGKVDRQALHRYTEAINMMGFEDYISSPTADIFTQNKQEDLGLETTRLGSICLDLSFLVAKLLRIEIDQMDNSETFLELGIDSLLLLEFIREIEVTFGISIEAQQFFEELETIDALAVYIEKNLPLKQESTYLQKSELDKRKIILNPEIESDRLLEQPAKMENNNISTNVSVPDLEEQVINQPNRGVKFETNVERIMSQQLQSMSQLVSQQLEFLRTEQIYNEKLLSKKPILTEFASFKSKSSEPSPMASQISPVCSYNEWDLLEEVIVGIVDGAMVPSWHTIHRATVLPGQEKQMDSLSKRTEKQPLPYPEWLVQDASRCVNEFAHILESEGVIVRRPDPIDYSASFRTPSWEIMNGFCSANPRDVFLVIGNEIIEAPMADRSRYFESWAYRSLLKEYSQAGAKWVAAPKPQLIDAQYDSDYKAPASGEERRFVITEFEPTFDAADFVRFGRDIFVQKSHVTNSLGIEWVRRHLGDEYRVHELQSLCPQALHIDTTLVPLAPGKVLVNPLFIDVDNLILGYSACT
jgi:amino acid adenylation domain-containing protein